MNLHFLIYHNQKDSGAHYHLGADDVFSWVNYYRCFTGLLFFCFRNNEFKHINPPFVGRVALETSDLENKDMPPIVSSELVTNALWFGAFSEYSKGVYVLQGGTEIRALIWETRTNSSGWSCRVSPRQKWATAVELWSRLTGCDILVDQAVKSSSTSPLTVTRPR